MGESVVVHNGFNLADLSGLTELEQNILFIMIAKMKDSGNKTIRLLAEDIEKMMITKIESREHFTAVIDSLVRKFFRISFRATIETEEEIIDSHFHLFNTMEVHYKKKNPDDGYDNSKIFCHIDLAVNQRFAFILNGLTANFTRFELVEFLSLSGKYTKTLYRLLKQYRSTGYMRMDWQEFVRVMGIPQSYKMCDIDKDIIKPALKQLANPRNLFDQVRTPFKNLAYKKLKQGGNRVAGIEFSFSPESKELENLQEQESKQKDQIIEQQRQEIAFRQNENFALQESMRKMGVSMPYAEYRDRSYTNSNGEVLKIVDITETLNKEINVRWKNMENDKTFTKTYTTENHFKKYLSNLMENY